MKTFKQHIKEFEIAKTAAKIFHEDQVDLGGNNYINHLETVAKSVVRYGTQYEAVAWLHDILEDTEMTEDILLEDFSKEVVDAVKALTKNNNEKYEQYLARVKGNTIATVVKLADMTHNSDLTRLSKITDNDVKRVAKYEKAKEFLAS